MQFFNKIYLYIYIIAHVQWLIHMSQMKWRINKIRKACMSNIHTFWKPKKNTKKKCTYNCLYMHFWTSGSLHWSLLAIIGCISLCWAFSAFIGVHGPLLAIFGLHGPLLGFVGLCWCWLAIVSICWHSWTFVGHCWALWAFVRLCWPVLALVGLCQHLLAIVSIHWPSWAFVGHCWLLLACLGLC